MIGARDAGHYDANEVEGSRRRTWAQGRPNSGDPLGAGDGRNVCPCGVPARLWPMRPNTPSSSTSCAVRRAPAVGSFVTCPLVCFADATRTLSRPFHSHLRLLAQLGRTLLWRDQLPPHLPGQFPQRRRTARSHLPVPRPPQPPSHALHLARRIPRRFSTRSTVPGRPCLRLFAILFPGPCGRTAAALSSPTPACQSADGQPNR